MTLFLDLDGPLLDVEERYFRVHHDILAELGYSDPVDDKASYWRMKRDRRPLSAFLMEKGKSLVDEGIHRRRWLETIESEDYLDFDRIIPGAKQQLGKLSGPHTLVLVTLRRNREGLIRELECLQLRLFFRAVLCKAQRTRDSWKVRHDLIRSSLLLEFDRWIIGDSEVDILAGKSLGLTTVAVLSGIRNLRC